MHKGKKINAIIQARMGSKRLPRKVLEDLGGKKVLDHIADRLGKSELIDEIIVATSIESQDDKIEEWGKSRDIQLFRGSEENVLKRFYDCSEKYPSDIICRIAADNPLISYKLIDQCIKLLIDKDCEYTSVKNDDIPLGTHGECLTEKALEEVYRKANKDYHKEHVTYYIYEDNGDEFETAYLKPPKWLKKDYRLTLDTELDYKLLKEIFSNLYVEADYLTLKEVINFLDQNPSKAKINESIKQKKVKENNG